MTILVKLRLLLIALGGYLGVVVAVSHLGLFGLGIIMVCCIFLGAALAVVRVAVKLAVMEPPMFLILKV